jgi:MFS family permease
MPAILFPPLSNKDEIRSPRADGRTTLTSSRCSWIGLCAVSFFLAEVNGVTMPFVNTFLQDRGWRYDTIGAVAALAGLVSLLVTLPGGFLIDRLPCRRLMLALTSLLVGGSIGLLPLAPATGLCVGGLLVAAAIGKPFFGPLTNALTLGLVGHQQMDRALGVNQAWNHAGNIAAALVAMALVCRLPVSAVFVAALGASALAAGAVLLIPPGDIDENRAAGRENSPAIRPAPFAELLRDRRIVVLLVSAALFHLANAPVMPLVAQKVRQVGGSNSHVAAVVFVAQAVMIPVAFLAGAWGPRFGRKRVLAAGFVVLPLRIVLYSFTDDPNILVLFQALDGIGAGIFGVTAVAICADITRGRGHFNATTGALATAGALGGVAGPLVGGFIVQHLGFTATFAGFAIVAASAPILFIGWMPEVRPADQSAEATPAQLAYANLPAD